jgi:GAF domain-containing protein/HAMP domain-containing protein
MSDALRTLSSAYRSTLGRIGLLGPPRRPRAAHASTSGLRGRLFRKYVLLLVGLVGLALLVDTGLHIWFSYSEDEAAALGVQQEMARSAAHRIEDFIDEIERQLGWTTAPQWAAASVEQRQFDYVRLLRQVPAITELIQLDGAGKEQLRVSRLAMDVVGSGKDYSQEPEFTEAKKHRVWFSAVYFRKESEPYLTLSMAQAGHNAGVTIAEVNLKLIWDVISGMKIGQNGYAYVIDRNGRLIAHPDISLVLRDTDLTGLPQVAAARAEAQTDQIAPPAIVAKNLNGETVLSAHATIVPLDWTVFVELPLREALAPLYRAAWRSAALLAFALVLATLAALVLARRMTGPIRLLQAGAARIGAGELDRRIDIHTSDELEDLAGEFNRMAGDLQKSYAELEQKVEDRTAELKEALDQQTATAEVLQVINSSPGNLKPVFDAMLDKAMRLCNAPLGLLLEFDGEYFRAATLHGAPPEYVEFMLRGPIRPGPRTGLARLAATRRLVHIEDLAAEAAYREGDPLRKASVDLAGMRTFLAVPLTKESVLLGAFVIYRQEIRPFSDKEIALLENFAAQAVIAMENARLITETREALEQQTATTEVLQVINSSPGDLGPVFGAVLEKAVGLCEAAFGSLLLYDGARFSTVAVHGVPAAFADYVKTNRPAHGPGTGPARILAGERVVHIADLAAEDAYRLGDPQRRALVDLGGARSLIGVPLLRDGAVLGMIAIYRQEVRPFSDKQIALLENFAAQAVIAMENARLLTETREALEQQTATADVLQVINSSPGDLAPVFDAILEKAHSLCGVARGSLELYDGQSFRAVATHGLADSFADQLRRGYPASDNPATRPLIEGQPFTQIPDIMQRQFPFTRGTDDALGARTLLCVPLRGDDKLLGMIASARLEVRPFADKQIALLQNFAAQAVIAMENARLITELRESLEYQTATSDVLRVVSRSTFDLDSVLQTVVTTAIRLCRADSAVIYRNEGGEYRWAAGHMLVPEYEEIERNVTILPGTGTVVGRAALEGHTVQILDAWTDPLYEAKEDAHVGGVHTMIGVPLLREGAPIGVIGLARRRVEAFSEREIQLVTTFADQAVIAIENARLITELRQRTRDLEESLEYQTASGDVLKVISQSGRELEPVLDTLVETAARICRADSGFVFRLQDGLCRMVASFGIPAEYRDFQERNPIAPGRGTLAGRTVLERRAVHIADAATDPEYTRVQAVQLGRQRTMLGVPLSREDALIGVITLARTYVEPFTEKQIGLVTTFADQAVIAIENARLFNELRERTAELGRSVEELKMLSEVGQAVSSTLDLRNVLSTILTASLGVTWANAGAVFRYSRVERAFRLVEAAGWDETLTRAVRDLRVAEAESAMGEAAARRTPVQLADLAQRPTPLREFTLSAGFHSALIVPLVGAERILGAIVLMRQEAGEFPPETVRLMQTLASQSVLAIQNARMFREIADKSEQLALASQHKSQFLANMSHELRTPLNAILGYAELLADGIYGALPDRPRGVLERIQNNGKHLLALINDVLDLAKIEAGQLTLTLEDYSLPEVVKSVVTATEPLATSKGLKFTAVVQDGLPTGHGDARRVSQVLLNLVGNAIKFTDQGEVEIRAALERGQFVLTVRDTGPGIAEAEQERIFGEFQQIDNSSTRQRGGTGLGLAISKRMVEVQGGTISVDSVPGHGSSFRVVLPVHVDEIMEEAA